MLWNDEKVTASFDFETRISALQHVGFGDARVPKPILFIKRV